MFIVSLADARRVLRIVLGLGIIAMIGMLTIGERTEDWATARQSFAGAHVFGVANACVHGIIVLFGLWLAQRKPWQLIALMVSAPPFIFTIIASGTRASILLTPVVMLVMVWMYRRKLDIKAIVVFTMGGAVVAAAVAAVLNPDLLYRFRPDAVREALETRIYLVRVTLHGFLTNPVLGHGPGDTFYQLRTLRYPHNHVLEVANEIGIFGLLAYLIVVGYGLKAWWYLQRPEYEGTEAKDVGVTVFGLLVYNGLWTLKSGSYAGAYHFYFFITMMVVVQGLGQRTMNRQRRKAAVGSPQRASALLDKRGPGYALTGGRGSR